MTSELLKNHSSLAILMASQVLKGVRRIESIKLPTLRAGVEEIIGDDDLIVSIFVNRVINGTETIETVPELYRQKVSDFLDKKSTSILILVSDLIDGVKRMEDIPESLRPAVQEELDRLLGKK